MVQQADIVIVGAGAAGLMAAIWAGRTNPDRRIVLLDGARSIGAKILVAGGGRCNVTHQAVDETRFSGSTPMAIRKVLRRFDVGPTVAFFRELGVELKREATGKLFPTTDRAQTVLQALLGETRRVGVELRHPRRVTAVSYDEDCFTVTGEWGSIRAPLVVLATGGKSLPKTGSDGTGYAIATQFGHTLSPRIFPALVPLVLAKDHFVRELSGVTLETTLEVRSSTGRRLQSFTNSTLCTHFGLSGPCVLDISRHYLDAVADDAGARLVINWLPGETVASLDAAFQSLNRSGPLRALTGRLPDRLARALCVEAGVEPGAPAHRLTRDQRRHLARMVTEMELPITGDRGYRHAEVTAGGVPLREIGLETMESRKQPGLFLCGEMCDVDGMIGGFNFQWAWASSYVAGVSIADRTPPAPGVD